MVKHTQRIHQQCPTNCLGVSDHFVGSGLKQRVNDYDNIFILPEDPIIISAISNSESFIFKTLFLLKIKSFYLCYVKPEILKFLCCVTHFEEKV